MSKPLLSVVIPIYFEENLIQELYSRVKKALSAISASHGLDHEIVFVNDGSTDRSLPQMKDLATRDVAVRILDLSRNFGHQLAITAGIDHARGDAVVVMDGDLQDPPEVIAEMIAKWRDGYHVVYGVRKRRSGETAFKLVTAKAFYKIIGMLSDTDMPFESGDFRLMDRKVVEALKRIREENRYIRGLVSWVGFKQIGVPYERDARYAGDTKYTLRKMVRFALDGITSFSEKPLRFSSYLGFAITGLALLFLVWIVANVLLDPASVTPGWASLMVAVLFLGGVQLLSIGVLGEYLGRIYRETKNRPLYIVGDRIGFGDQGDEPGARR